MMRRTQPIASGVLLVASLVASGSVSHGRATVTPDDPRVIGVVAQRFSFEPSIVEVTVGEPVRLVVSSADGVHGLEIRRLGIRRVIPRRGDPVTIDFTASEAGQFPILCSEYCGDGHDDMRATLVVRARPVAGGPA